MSFKRQLSKTGERLELELLVAGTEFAELERTVYKVGHHIHFRVQHIHFRVQQLARGSAIHRLRFAGHEGQYEGSQGKACTEDP